MKWLTRTQRLLVLAMLVLAPLAAGCARKSTQAPPEPPPAPPQQTTPAPTPTPTPTPESTPAQRPVSSSDFQPVFFDFDSYALRGDARAALDADARLLRDNSGIRLVIEGHCDERGTVEYNQALGERRAQAAFDYLVRAGVSASRMQVVSYGKERPFDTGHDEAAWAKNRRAHFVLQ